MSDDPLSCKHEWTTLPILTPYCGLCGCVELGAMIAELAALKESRTLRIPDDEPGEAGP